jgi:hypothetical protein
MVLNIEVFIRDDYTERQYDFIGRKPSLRQIAKIDSDSRQELFKAIKDSAEKNTSLIVESNFMPWEKNKVKALIPQDAVVVEFFCFTKASTRLKRYIRRNKSGERHWGHRDHLHYPVVALEALGPARLIYKPLNITPNLMRVDTNNFADIDYGAIREFVAKANKPSKLS